VKVQVVLDKEEYDTLLDKFEALKSIKVTPPDDQIMWVYDQMIKNLKSLGKTVTPFQIVEFMEARRGVVLETVNMHFNPK